MKISSDNNFAGHPPCDRPSSLAECLSFDGLSPRSLLGKIAGVILLSAYSIMALIRIAQRFSDLEKRSTKQITRKYYALMVLLTSRLNQILNGVYCHPDARIGKNALLNYGNMVITGFATIESDVRLYQGAYIAADKGEAPLIKRGATIYGHTMIIGGVTIGEGAIVAPGAVVLIDVPDNMIAAGVPAKIIGKVKQAANA